MEQRTLYLIDDDDGVLGGLSFLLCTAGYRVLAYRSAMDFLERFPEEPKGCIVTDVRMPGVNGIALTAQLRGRGLTLPVIVISGHGDIPMAVQAVRAGAFDFIEKPFEDEVLIESLTRAFSAEVGPEDRARLGRSIEALSVEDRTLLDCLLAGWDNQRMAAHFDMHSREVELRMGHIISGMAAGNLSTLLRSLLALRRART